MEYYSVKEQYSSVTQLKFIVTTLNETNKTHSYFDWLPWLTVSHCFALYFQTSYNLNTTFSLAVKQI